MAKINADSIVVASKDQMASSLGGETVILGMTKGRYYGVSDVSARVWQLVQSPIRVADLQQMIVSEYAVSAEQCEIDLAALLEKLLNEGLVEVHSAASA